MECEEICIKASISKVSFFLFFLFKLDIGMISAHSSPISYHTYSSWLKETMMTTVDWVYYFVLQSYGAVQKSFPYYTAALSFWRQRRNVMEM